MWVEVKAAKSHETLNGDWLPWGPPEIAQSEVSRPTRATDQAVREQALKLNHQLELVERRSRPNRWRVTRWYTLGGLRESTHHTKACQPSGKLITLRAAAPAESNCGWSVQYLKPSNRQWSGNPSCQTPLAYRAVAVASPSPPHADPLAATGAPTARPVEVLTSTNDINTISTSTASLRDRCIRLVSGSGFCDVHGETKKTHEFRRNAKISQWFHHL